MKFLVSQLTYFFRDKQVRSNLGALRKYLFFVLVVVVLYSVLFHFIMFYAEGERHSWLTGFYWTFTVMSTLGFGDITFHSDIGRLFSIMVLLSGIILLMIMLPFTFIRYFYAPWLEAQIRLKAPRSLDSDVTGHVVICRYESIAPGLIRKLIFNEIPYCVIEPDPVEAVRLMADDVSVVTGALDSPATYEHLRIHDARMVFANAEDTTNTSAILTIKQVAPKVLVSALAENEGSIDILELSGADHVLPLKRKLGEHLAARISSGPRSAYVLGSFKDFQIAEFIVHETALAGKSIKDSQLRERTGVNIVAVWEKGKLTRVHPDLVLSKYSVPVAAGTTEQLLKLNKVLETKEKSRSSVLVIGGGKVGRAAAIALKARGVSVNVVEKNEVLGKGLLRQNINTIIGDAADRDVLLEAGLEKADAVALTTNNDAVNVYLSVYCRRLRPDLNIVSRIERNVDAIYRAGADFVLSYASLGREYLISLLLGRGPILVGEGADFFLVGVPESLAGKSLGESLIGERSGLIVIGVEENDHTIVNPLPSLILQLENRLIMLGTAEQRHTFSEEFGRSGSGNHKWRNSK